MNRKTGQRKTSESIEKDDSEYMGVEEITENDLIDLEPSYTMKVLEFIEKAKIDVQPRYYLYKYDDYNNGEKKALVDRYFEGDPPDEHEIGLKFGSGRWILIMVVPGRKKENIRAYRFRTHPRYDNLVATDQPQQQGTVVVPFQQRPDNNRGLTEALGVIERLMCSIVPLFQKPENPDMGNLMMNSYNTMNTLLKKQMMENIETLNDFQRNVGSRESLEMPATEEEPSVIEQLTPLLSEFLPMILGGGPKAQAVSQVVKATPQFKNIIQDRGQFRKVVAYLDKQEGTEKTDEILKQLKLKRK